MTKTVSVAAQKRWFTLRPAVRYFRAMISIQKLTPADAALLANVGGISVAESHGRSAAVETMQAYVDAAFSEQACLAELADERNVFHAIFYNGEPAGYSKIVFNVPHPAVPLQPVTKLERLYLMAAFYDLKLGYRLFQNTVDLSKAAGDVGMWLNVWKENERAIRFYEKQGFETVGESSFALTAEHSNPNWVMALRY